MSIILPNSHVLPKFIPYQYKTAETLLCMAVLGVCVSLELAKVKVLHI